MKGEQFARNIEQLLAERGITKGKFYADIGISATALYGWKRGAEPKRETIEAVERYFGVSFSETSKTEPETDELREMLRDRQDLRILLHSAKDVPASSVYALIAQIEKMKESET